MTAFYTRIERGLARASLACTVLAIAAVASGCSADNGAPASEAEKLVRATLQTLATDHRPICVENRTNGKPLAIFATMTATPAPAQRVVGWHAIAPLGSGPTMSNTQIYRDTFDRHVSRLAEPGNPARPLGLLAQQKLNAAARSLALTGEPVEVYLGNGLGVAGVDARWWPLLRLSSKCPIAFTLSNPVLAKDIGYITVQSGHWGTTYALQPRDGTWVPVAQWSNWLY